MLSIFIFTFDSISRNKEKKKLLHHMDLYMAVFNPKTAENGGTSIIINWFIEGSLVDLRVCTTGFSKHLANTDRCLYLITVL